MGIFSFHFVIDKLLANCYSRLLSTYFANCCFGSIFAIIAFRIFFANFAKCSSGQHVLQLNVADRGGSSHWCQDGLRCSVVQVVQVVEVVQMIKVVRTVWVVSLDDMCSENICLTWFTIKFLRKVEMSVT